MAKLDSFLLQKFQAISDWFQERFSITNFFLAKVFLIFFVTISINRDLKSIANLQIDMGTIISITAIPILGFGFAVAIWYAEKTCRNTPLFKNPLCVYFDYFRFLGLSALLLVPVLPMFPEEFILTLRKLLGVKYSYPEGQRFLSKGIILCFFLFAYFASCTPKPPSKSKVREMLEKIFGRRQLARA